MNRAAGNVLVPAAVALYPLAAVALFFWGNWYGFFHAYSLAMFFGLLSYCHFAVVLVLGSRVKALDRILGHDRALVIHGIVAGMAVAEALVHAALKRAYINEDTPQSLLGSIGLALFLSVILITVLLMLHTPLDRTPPFSLLTRFLKKTIRVDYTLLKLIHNLTAPAFALVIIHVLLASPVRETAGKTAFAGITGLIALAFYAWHRIARPVLSLLNASVVTGIRGLADGIVEIGLADGRARTMRHKAGQFAFFRFLDRTCGRGEHPFTISSPPSARGLTITVKAVGDYTSKLGSLKANAKCLVDGPYGLFYPKDGDGELLLIAGGIGITPFLSMLRDFAERPRAVSVSLLWSVRSRDEAFALEELKELSSRLPAFVFRVMVTGGPSSAGIVPDGRIDGRDIGEALSRFGTPRAVKAFICGPDAFRRSMQGFLREAGVPQGNVAFESFSL